MQSDPIRIESAVGLLSPAHKLVIKRKELLQYLPKPYRDVLIAYYLENKTIAEISKQLGIKWKSAFKRRETGLRKLKRRLRPDYQLVIQNQELLKYLPELYTKVLTAYYLKGKTTAEIEKNLGITGERAIDKCRVTGLRKLKRLLRPDYQFVIKNKKLFQYLSDLHKKVLTYFYLKGRTDSIIARDLRMSERSVGALRKSGTRRLSILLRPDNQFVIKNKKLLKYLPVLYRNILTAFYLKGKKGEDIARDRGLTAKTLYSRKRIGVELLREVSRQGPNHKMVTRQIKSERLLKEIKIIRQSKNLLTRKYLTRQRIKVLKLLLEGETASDIARKFKITKQAVSDAKILGLKRIKELVEAGENKTIGTSI